MPRSKGRPQPPTPPSPGWQESAGQAHRVRRVRREQPRARPPPAGAGFASNQSPRFTRVAIGSPARRQLSAPVRTTRNKGALGMGWACLGGPLGLPPGTKATGKQQPEGAGQRCAAPPAGRHAGPTPHSSAFLRDGRSSPPPAVLAHPAHLQGHGG